MNEDFLFKVAVIAVVVGFGLPLLHFAFVFFLRRWRSE